MYTALLGEDSKKKRVWFILETGYYSPALGRFIQPDPLGYVDAPNLYQYAYNDPGSYLDPFGLSTSFEQKSVADRILDLLPRKKFTFSGTLTLWIFPTPAGPIVVDFTLSASGEPCCKEKTGKRGLLVEGSAAISFTYSWGYGEEPSDEEETGWLQDKFKGKKGKKNPGKVKKKKRKKKGKGRKKKKRTQKEKEEEKEKKEEEKEKRQEEEETQKAKTQ